MSEQIKKKANKCRSKIYFVEEILAISPLRTELCSLYIKYSDFSSDFTTSAKRLENTNKICVQLNWRPACLMDIFVDEERRKLVRDDIKSHL